MTSIRTKIIAIIAACILLVSLSIGGLAIMKSNAALTTESKKQLGLLSDEAANRIITSNLRIETSVNDMESLIISTIDLSKAKDKEYMKSYTEKLSPTVKSFGERTYTSMGSYVYFKPESFDGLHYVWYASEDGKFLPKEDGVANESGYLRMDTPKYSENEDYVWYYKPMKAEKGVWTEIYFDNDLKTNSISYVKPMVKDGQIIGMTGMDMSFDETKNTIDQIKIYETGYAFLLDSNNEFIVAPKQELPEGLVESISKNTAAKEVFEQDDLLVAYNKLENGQTVVVVAPKSEVLAPVRSLMMQFIAITAIITIIMLALGLYLVNRISSRILKLKEAADKITNGDFDVQLPPATENDEVSGLTASLEMLVAGFKAKMKK